VNIYPHVKLRLVPLIMDAEEGEIIRTVLKTHFHKSVVSIKQLVGYEDRNFLITFVDGDSDTSQFGQTDTSQQHMILKQTSSSTQQLGKYKYYFSILLRDDKL